MKKLLNTLYITSKGAWARKDGANIVVQVDGVERGRAPLHLLGSVICFGQAGLSPQLMHACAEAGVSVVFLSAYGKFLARVEGPTSGNVLLRRAQHKHSLEVSEIIARPIVAAKAANQRGVLRRYLRDYDKSAEKVVAAERRLSDVARKALEAETTEHARGLEGEGANAYFSVFNEMIRVEGMPFKGRSRRPPLDEPNALLSFLYVLLAADCRSALESVGLDPQIGFLHRDRPGRASLALDLMEEFRAPLVDRLCLSLLNRRQLSASDFRREETGGVFLKEDSRKVVLEAWQARKRASLMHPFLEEKMPLGLFPYVQAQLLARSLRGDLGGYPAFIWR